MRSINCSVLIKRYVGATDRSDKSLCHGPFLNSGCMHPFVILREVNQEVHAWRARASEARTNVGGCKKTPSAGMVTSGGIRERPTHFPEETKV